MARGSIPGRVLYRITSTITVLRLRFEFVTEANPYEPTESNAHEQRSAFPGRLAVLAIHFALLFSLLVGGPMLSAFVSAESGSGTLETELSGLDDFLRAFANYSFVPVMIVFLLDLPVYFVIRYLKGCPTRWVWLRWTTVLIPFAIALYYIGLWPMLRIPIEI